MIYSTSSNTVGRKKLQAGGCTEIDPSWIVAHYKFQGTAQDETGTYDGTESTATYSYSQNKGIHYDGGGSITIPATGGVSCTYWLDSGSGFVFTYSTTIPSTLTTNSYADLVVYNKTLTTEEQTFVEDLQRDIHNIPIDNGLVSYYPLDGDSLDNSIGQNDGTDTANIGYVYDSALGNTVAEFDRTSGEYINTGYTMSGDRTISIWFYRETNQYSYIFSSSAGTTQQGVYAYALDGSTNIEVKFFQSSVEQANVIISASLNEWHNLTLCMSNGDIRFYLDTVEVLNNSGSVNGTADYGPMTLGNTVYTYTTAFPFDGFLSNARFYNRALSAQEVSAIYEYEKPNSTVCNALTTETHDIFGDGSCVATYNLDGDATDLGGTYNGTPVNATYSNGRFLQGLQGDKTTHRYISSSLSLGVTSSVSFWVYLPDNTGDQVIISDNANYFFAGTYTSYWVKNTTDLHFVASDSSKMCPNANTWYHIVITDDGSQIRGYRNGVEVTNSAPYYVSLNGFTFNYMGAYTSAATSHSGILDQLRMFNRALTEDEVVTLFYENQIVLGA